MNHTAGISGTGVFTPPNRVTNDELVAAYNAYADLFNAENAGAIEAGEIEAKPHSSSEFIVKASGIEHRYVMSRDGLLDPEIMHPLMRQRSDDAPSSMAEMALAAAKKAGWMASVLTSGSGSRKKCAAQSKLAPNHLCGLKTTLSAPSTPVQKWRNSGQIIAAPAQAAST